MSERNTIVETTGLTKVYGDGAEVRALDGVDLTIWAGEFLSIMGPSGSGKSTLLHLLGALDRPTSGQIVIDGQDLARVRRLDRFRSRTVGFVFQFHNLIPSLTAVENVETPLAEISKRGRSGRKWALELLDWVGLSARADHLPSQLSGGASASPLPAPWPTSPPLSWPTSRRATWTRPAATRSWRSSAG